MKQIKNQELLLPVSAKEMWVDDRTGLVHFKNAKRNVEVSLSKPLHLGNNPMLHIALALH